VYTDIRSLITGIISAVYSVTAINRHAGLTAARGIANFSPVAVQAITAGCIVGDVVTAVRGLIAGISGAGYPVIAVNRCAGLAVSGSGIAGFNAGAV